MEFHAFRFSVGAVIAESASMFLVFGFLRGEQMTELHGDEPCVIRFEGGRSEINQIKTGMKGVDMNVNIYLDFSVDRYRILTQVKLKIEERS